MYQTKGLYAPYGLRNAGCLLAKNQLDNTSVDANKPLTF